LFFCLWFIAVDEAGNLLAFCHTLDIFHHIILLSTVSQINDADVAHCNFNAY